MSWELVFAKQAQKDLKKLAAGELKSKAEELLKILKTDPFQSTLSFEKLVGDLNGAYSRRVKFQYRLAYEVFVFREIVRVVRMWTHYE